MLPAGAKRTGLCVNGRRWVTTGCPWHPALRGGHPTSKFASGTFVTHAAFRTPHSSPPDLWQRHHVVPVSLPAGFVPPQGCCADGSGPGKAHARPKPRPPAPDPGERGKGGGFVPSQGEKRGLPQPLPRMRQVRDAFPLFNTWVS